MHLYSTARKTPCDSSCANSTKTGQKVLLSFLACFRPSLPCCKSKEKKPPAVRTYLGVCSATVTAADQMSRNTDSLAPVAPMRA